jgi:hypothetical protein
LRVSQPPDGKRFLIITAKTQETSSLNVILNWRPQKQLGARQIPD